MAVPRRLGSEPVARAAAVLLLGLRGTPFLYAGEELGLEDAVVPAELVQDPAGFRDGCRAPIPWDATPQHGWAGAEQWLPWPPDPDTRNAAVLRDDADSIVHLYRRLLHARRSSPALRSGSQTLLPTHDEVLAWERTADADRRVVVVNFAAEPRPFTPPPGEWRVQVSSTGESEGESLPGELAPHQAVVLEPAG